MSLVLDCSAALACCFEDELTPAVSAMRDHIALNEAFVPAIWRLEIANGLRSGVKRGRITPEKRDAMLARFEMLAIHTDLETDRYAWNITHRLSVKHDITPYDASYLELAKRMVLPLATGDATMRRVAVAENIPLYPL